LWTIHVDRRSMFRQEFRLGVLRGAERTLPPWLKVPPETTAIQKRQKK
jgi:hypothetical protein